jgi:hypothetical protein
MLAEFVADDGASVGDQGAYDVFLQREGEI